MSDGAYLVDDPRNIGEPNGVILPGVGEFSACMNALESKGFRSVVLGLVEDSVPVLGLCVGMQMLFDGSDESPGSKGLGLLSGRVRRIRNARRLPQMQWNRLDLVGDGGELLRNLPEDPWVYFVHSYAVTTSRYATSTCNYGEDLVASVQVGALFGTQFHPEKSSGTGLTILRNFVDFAEGRARETNPSH